MGRFVGAAVSDVPADRAGFRAPGDPQRDAMEPARDGFSFPDRLRPPGQHEERGLPGVVNIARIVEHLTAHAFDQEPVSFDEHFERQLAGLIAPGEELGEQLRIGHAGAGACARQSVSRA